MLMTKNVDHMSRFGPAYNINVHIVPWKHFFNIF